MFPELSCRVGGGIREESRRNEDDVHVGNWRTMTKFWELPDLERNFVDPAEKYRRGSDGDEHTHTRRRRVCIALERQ